MDNDNKEINQEIVTIDNNNEDINNEIKIKERIGKKVTVLGGGSFGTALGTVLAWNGLNVCILTRSKDVEESINNNHRNPRYFSEFELPINLTCTTDAKEAFNETNFILHAIPVQSSPEYLSNLKHFIPPSVPFISTSKGIHSETLKYMNEIIPEALGFSPPTAYFSGPTFAKELLLRLPTAVVVAGEEEVAKEVREIFRNEKLRVYITKDVVGVEVGGALKNIFAIGGGIVEGLGLGYNTLAALVTIGCSEMRRLALALGANPHTFSGLSGIGDLMLTCYGGLSRNKQVGIRLGKGEKLKEIMESMKEVAEGVYTTPAALLLSERHSLDLPIVRAVSNVLAGTQSPSDALSFLMTRPQPSLYEYYS